jgi:D-sedoheptulose 7-phosphate isomerase
MNALAFQTPAKLFSDYSGRLSAVLQGFDFTPVERLAYDLRDCWQSGRQVFLCGNGGSGGNANHLANDLLYALSKTKGSGLRVHSLSANPSTLTCLANDEGYDQVFSLQLAVLARAGDVLVVFSGSGNSPNIVNALEEAKAIGMTSYAVPIHFAIDDMQIAEDAQMVIGHMLMQWLYAQRGQISSNRAG